MRCKFQIEFGSVVIVILEVIVVLVSTACSELCFQYGSNFGIGKLQLITLLKVRFSERAWKFFEIFFYIKTVLLTLEVNNFLDNKSFLRQL